MSGPLVVVGDVLLDVDLMGSITRVAPDAPVPVVDVDSRRERPGGAALAALLAARAGAEVVLLAPIADDEAGRRVRALLAPHVTVVDWPVGGTTPVKQRVRAGQQFVVRLDSGATEAVGAVPDEAAELLATAGACLVSDYGRGAADALRPLLTEVARRTPIIWDPHPHGGAPVPGARLVTPNLREAQTSVADDMPATGLAGASALARALVEQWQVQAVAVTMGDAGALIAQGGGAPLVVPALRAHGGDPCGAGDCFAATAAVHIARGALATEAVQAAVTAATAFVAAGGAGAVNPDVERPVSVDGSWGQGVDAVELAQRVRREGGTVVATGGCFDLLHAGHVATLRAARSLGDCLIVCVNSDDSVRRLKGSSRPLQNEADRRTILQELECVDAVAVFGEDTPETVIAALMPHVWVKGGDYAGVELPESALLRTWGGDAVVLPYISGKSTTSLVTHARTSVRENGALQ